jgi:signal peptidase I
MIGSILAVAAVITALVAVRRLFVVVRVRGNSMVPTFDDGDVLIATRARRSDVFAGDIVIVGPRKRATDAPRSADGRAPMRIVKRAVAIAGDPVPRAQVQALANVQESVVPDGKIVLVGDSTNSFDSRQRGYYDATEVIAVVLRRVARYSLSER